MKVILKESTRVVYEQKTHQIKVEIDGKEYTIRNSEDDNGVEYYVFNEDLGDSWVRPHTIEDVDLRETIELLPMRRTMISYLVIRKKVKRLTWKNFKIIKMVVKVQRLMDDGYGTTHVIGESVFDETLYEDIQKAESDNEIYDALLEIVEDTDVDLYENGNPMDTVT